MSKTAIILSCLLAVSLTAQAQSQGAKRGLGGLGAGLSEWADRQAALNAEIELAKAKAAIELETQRKLQALRAEQTPQRATEQEEVKLRQRHPQWVGIINSMIFKTWLGTRPVSYQQTCMRTPEAEVLGSCIDDFFNAKIVQVQ